MAVNLRYFKDKDNVKETKIRDLMTEIDFFHIENNTPVILNIRQLIFMLASLS